MNQLNGPLLTHLFKVTQSFCVQEIEIMCGLLINHMAQNPTFTLKPVIMDSLHGRVGLNSSQSPAVLSVLGINNFYNKSATQKGNLSVRIQHQTQDF